MCALKRQRIFAQHKKFVGEVAYLVGIKDHAYFTYLFRKETGMTPTEYRLSLMQSQFA
ncbi:MAG: AraC family transcriptional regulator [Deltaproteobacteria bacterium]|nr:AraC family transcriptional regulator [Deltaproteobacteria bacterium]